MLSIIAKSRPVHLLIHRNRPLPLAQGRRHQSSRSEDVFGGPPKEFKVLLDNQTLYIDQELAQALGWNPKTGHAGLGMTLNGWAPKYFTITPTGSDADKLARATVESSQNPKVKFVLDYLKDR